MPVIFNNKNLTINDKVYQNKGVLSIYSDENDSKFNEYSVFLMTFFIQKFFLTSKENTLIQLNRLTSKYGKSDTEVFVFFLITAKKI